jgi:hypothetical protein
MRRAPSALAWTRRACQAASRDDESVLKPTTLVVIPEARASELSGIYSAISGK